MLVKIDSATNSAILRRGYNIQPFGGLVLLTKA